MKMAIVGAILGALALLWINYITELIKGGVQWVNTTDN